MCRLDCEAERCEFSTVARTDGGVGEGVTPRAERLLVTELFLHQRDATMARVSADLPARFAKIE